MKFTDKEYKELVKQNSKKSPILKNCAFAFIIGGLICVLGEALSKFFLNGGLSLDDSRTAASVSLIFLGSFFTGIGVYAKLAKVAGAGSLVPITGFANAITAPAMEFKCEGMVAGLGAKMFVIAGPVIVYGIIASTLYGFLLLLFQAA